MGMQIEAGTWGAESPNTSGNVRSDSGRAGASARSAPSGSDAVPTLRSRSARSATALWPALRKDYRRYRAAGARNALSVIALTQGFWASAVFRVSHWMLARLRAPGLHALVNAACLSLQKLIEVATGISIPAQCNIGPGLYIGHFGGIFIDSRCLLGENCNVAQGVTIGEGGRGELHGVPIIGDRVHIGANALILGKISIGNDAVIGPGAVVMNSVPACGVAVGNPARVVGLTGS